jgi:uncharacterized protein YjbJ (UPF0337 family)
MWNKNELRGKAGQLKGRVKEAVGDLKNDQPLRDRGTAEKVTGQVEEDFGKGRRKVGNAVKSLGRTIKR